MVMVDNIEVNTQNSIRIASRVGIIYIDPLAINDEVHDADFILITHDHYDHFSWNGSWHDHLSAACFV